MSAQRHTEARSTEFQQSFARAFVVGPGVNRAVCGHGSGYLPSAIGWVAEHCAGHDLPQRRFSQFPVVFR